jgi:hypothetical protein
MPDNPERTLPYRDEVILSRYTKPNEFGGTIRVDILTDGGRMTTFIGGTRWRWIVRLATHKPKPWTFRFWYLLATVAPGRWYVQGDGVVTGHA